MKVDLGIWNKLTWIVIVIGLVGGLALVADLCLPLIEQNERYRRQVAELDKQIRQEEETARQLKASIDAVSRDPRTVERLAREILHYGKPEETIIRFDPPASNGAARR